MQCVIDNFTNKIRHCSVILC